MPGSLTWGWDPDNKVWVPIKVSPAGSVYTTETVDRLNDIGDVEVPTPTDGYILYWDAATSLWKCKAIPGMAVHGNEYHDPDFATEAALASHAAAATGIHGVGSAYIAKSSAGGLDLADHDSRHGYLGADELPVLYLNAQRAIPMINKHFGDLGGLTEGHSGGSLILGIVFGTLKSGSTTNNYGRVYMSQACFHNYPSYGHTLGIRICMRQSTQQDMWLGWFESTTPGTNQNHYAFRITNNNLYAYAGKSDTYKENSGSLATWSGIRDFFLSVRDSSDAIKFYVDHTLAYSVTNTNNRPTGVNLYLVFYLKTTEAVQKECFLLPFTLFPTHAY